MFLTLHFPFSYSSLTFSAVLLLSDAWSLHGEVPLRFGSCALRGSLVKFFKHGLTNLNRLWQSTVIFQLGGGEGKVADFFVKYCFLEQLQCRIQTAQKKNRTAKLNKNRMAEFDHTAEYVSGVILTWYIKANYYSCQPNMTMQPNK